MIVFNVLSEIIWKITEIGIKFVNATVKDSFKSSGEVVKFGCWQNMLSLSNISATLCW